MIDRGRTRRLGIDVHHEKVILNMERERTSSESSAAEPDEQQADPARFPVVGIGASAGDVEAITSFFSHVPPDNGMAFLVMLDLLSDASQVAAIVGRCTAMSVVLIHASVRLHPDRVYIVPPDARFAIVDGTLRRSDAAPTDGTYSPIDQGFRTLAEAYGNQAAAIVLSGAGNDGAIGLGRVKEAGGATFAQDPRGARFDTMPRAAIGTGWVDVVRAAPDLPATLIAYWQHNAVRARRQADESLSPAAASDALVTRLEAELERAKSQLRATIEQHEATVEGYQAANKALQAINEELRAANQELKHTVDEVIHAHNDLQNLISATHIGSIFLDRKLHIKRYTPGVETIFHLIPADRNRPLDHVTQSLLYDRLVQDAADVNETLTPLSREVQAKNGAWYLLRLRPYRTLEDRNDGVVLTFVDISERKQAEQAAHESEVRQAFLLHLSDALRGLADATLIQQTSTRLLSEYLSASRVHYAEALADEDSMIAGAGFADGVPPLTGLVRVSDFDTTALAAYRAGRTVVIADVTSERRTQAQRAMFDAFGIRAVIGVPLVKDGYLLASLAVHQSEPRNWTIQEIALVEEVAARTWAAVERARAEKALRESNARLQLALSAANMGTFVWYSAQDRTEADERMLALFGLPPDGTITLAHALAMLIAPEDRDRYAAAIRQAIDPHGSGKLREDIHIIHPNGSEHWIAISGQTYSEGAAPRLVGIATDITERKRAEAALRESEQRVRALIENLPGGAVFIVDRHLRYLIAEGEALCAAGLTPEALVGHTIDEALPPELSAQLKPMYRRALGGESFEHEHNAYDRAFVSRGVPLRGDNGEVYAVLAVSYDITERKHIEAERERLLATEHVALADAEAALHTRDQFLSIASHELRTPLTSLIGYVHMLPVMITQGKDQAVKIADLVTRQAQRLNTLIDQLLDVSRLQQGQFALSVQPVDFAALVAQVIDEYCVTLPTNSKHSIDLHHPNEPIIVAGDAQRLEQVVMNVLTNAVKYSPAGGAVDVRIVAGAAEIVLEVTDHGIGIPVEAQARLFEPFFRANNVGPHISGFGLGLHVVQEIVQRHGGRIEIESAEGAGSTFRIVLPRAAGNLVSPRS